MRTAKAVPWGDDSKNARNPLQGTQDGRKLAFRLLSQTVRSIPILPQGEN
jgi:hypothetical protein